MPIIDKRQKNVTTRIFTPTWDATRHMLTLESAYAVYFKASYRMGADWIEPLLKGLSHESETG